MTEREQRIAAALAAMLPRVPEQDRRDILARAAGSRGLRRASPEAAAWLSAVAHIRHVHTEYETLLAEGYGVEAARHFCLADINAVLAQWGCRRRAGTDE